MRHPIQRSPSDADLPPGLPLLQRARNLPWLLLAALGVLTAGFEPALGQDDVLCTLGPEGGPSRSLDTLPDLELLHCTCPESIAFFANSDRQFEAALTWQGAGMAAPHYGAFAERYETPNQQAGAVCQIVLQVTDNGNAIPSEVDLYIWRDDGGQPGEIAGIVTGQRLGPVPTWPVSTQRLTEVYEHQQIGVEGAYWVGLRGAWEPDSCSIHLAMDLSGDHPETVRGGMTYVAPGLDYPAGWHTIEEIYGRPAALGISVIVGWCPVPTQSLSWGRVKGLYR